MESEKKSRYLIAIGATIVTIAFFYPQTSRNEDVNIRIAEAFGSALVPILIAFLAGFWTKSFRGIFFTTWLILVGLIWLGRNVTPTTTEVAASNAFVYGPENCPFQVTFSEKPKIKQTEVMGDGKRIPSELAEVERNGIVQRTELAFSTNYSSSFSQEQIYDFFEQYSELNGFEFPEMSYVKNKMGATGQMRAYKKMRNVQYILAMHVYLQDSCAFMLSAFCPASKYPTKETQAFLGSIRLK